MNIVIPVDHPQYQAIMRGTLARLAGQPELTEAELAERRKQYDNMQKHLAALHAECDRNDPTGAHADASSTLYR